MNETADVNIDELLAVAHVEKGGTIQEFKVEEMMGKLRRLQQEKRISEEQIKQLKLTSDSLQKELDTLQTEVYQLEEIHKEKEELCRKLRFQYEESEQDCNRQLNLNKNTDELLKQYTCEIQEFKLKQRKQRMKFVNQLHQQMEQHKSLHSMFSLESLPEEIKSAENTNNQMLSSEQAKLAQLSHLSEELEEAKKQKQPSATSTETQEESNTSL